MHTPAGWSQWMGLRMNSRYYNYTVRRNGNMQHYGDQYPKVRKDSMVVVNITNNIIIRLILLHIS